MGSDETATATTGGPRVIDVFDGNEAPSGPNYLLFSGVDRLLDSLRDRSKLGWSPTPHARVLGALQRALDRKLWGIMAKSWPNLESAQTLQFGTHDCAQLTGGSTRGHDPAAKSARRLSSGSVHNHTSRQNRFWAAIWTRASGSPRTPRGGTAATPRGASDAAGSPWTARSAQTPLPAQQR